MLLSPFAFNFYYDNFCSVQFLDWYYIKVIGEIEPSFSYFRFSLTSITMFTKSSKKPLVAQHVTTHCLVILLQPTHPKKELGKKPNTPNKDRQLKMLGLPRHPYNPVNSQYSFHCKLKPLTLEKFSSSKNKCCSVLFSIQHLSFVSYYCLHFN